MLVTSTVNLTRESGRTSQLETLSFSIVTFARNGKTFTPQVVSFTSIVLLKPVMTVLFLNPGLVRLKYKYAEYSNPISALEFNVNLYLFESSFVSLQLP